MTWSASARLCSGSCFALKFRIPQRLMWARWRNGLSPPVSRTWGAHGQDYFSGRDNHTLTRYFFLPTSLWLIFLFNVLILTAVFLRRCLSAICWSDSSILPDPFGFFLSSFLFLISQRIFRFSSIFHLTPTRPFSPKTIFWYFFSSIKPSFFPLLSF